jgi:uncharacterized protein YjiK
MAARLMVERLDERRLLAGYDLANYALHQMDTRLASPPDTALDDVSGVAYVADAAGDRIFVVRNEPTAVYEYRLADGRPPSLVRTIKLTGLSGDGRKSGGDTEGIVYLGQTDAGDERFAIVEERIGHIQTFAISAKTTTVDRSDMKPIVPKTNPVTGGNDGLEGITYRRRGDADGDFYVVKEAGKNMGVWQVKGDGETTEVDVRDRAGTPLSKVVKDAADIHYAEVDGAPTLFVLSQEDRRILQIKLEGTSGTIVAKRRLEPDFAREAKQAEGIVFSPDGRDLIVVGEPAMIFHCRVRDEKDADLKCSTGVHAVDVIFGAGLLMSGIRAGFWARREDDASTRRPNRP